MQKGALVLSRLVDKSLVVHASDPVERRFSLLETTAEYAYDKLMAAAEEELARDLHLAYFVRAAEEWGDRLRTSEDPDWKDVIQRDELNFMGALEWAKRSGNTHNLAALASSLWFFWDVRSQWNIGRQWLHEGLVPSLQPDLEIRTQAGASFMSLNMADASGIRDHAPRAVALWKQIGEPASLAWFAAWSLCDLAFAALLEDDPAASLEPARRASEVADRAEEPSAKGRALYTLGFATQPHDLGAAESHFREALTLARQHGMQVGLPRILTRLAEVALARRDVSTARRHLEEVAEVARTLDDKVMLAEALLQLAELEQGQSHVESASALRREGEAILERVGLAREVGALLTEAARARLVPAPRERA